MLVFGARSPYFVSINETGQTQAKIELYIWRKGETEPTTPNYVLIEGIPSLTNREVVFNISPFVLQFFSFANLGSITISEENPENWAFVSIIPFAFVDGDWVELATQNPYATNGYSLYNEGANFDFASEWVGLITPLKSMLPEIYLPNEMRYMNIMIEPAQDTLVDYTVNGVTTTQTILEAGTDVCLYRVPLTLNTTDEVTDVRIYQLDLSIEYTTRVRRICEPKYTPVVVDFINRFGGWDFITFFKTRTDSVATDSKPYRLNQSNWQYTPVIGESKEFNFSQKQTVKLSTGFVPETYNDLIMQLMASQTILLGGRPALVKTKSLPLKSQLNNRLINYEVEFEMNYNIINEMQ